MLQYQIEILDRRLPFLLDNLILDSTFFAYVRERELLNDDSIQDIEAQTTDRKQIVRFTELLKKQAPKKFSIFMDILKVTKQDHIFKEVNKAKQKKISKLPKSPDVEKNAKQKLFSDTVPSHLSTSERDTLAKLFVLREDYDDINEDKHIQIQENVKLQIQLKDALDSAEYEMKHHKLVKGEYEKLKKVKEDTDYKLTEQEVEYHKLKTTKDDMHDKLIKQKCEIKELKEKVAELEQRKKQYMLCIDNYKQLLESMEQDLKEIHKKQYIEQRSTEKNQHIVHVTSSTYEQRHQIQEYLEKQNSFSSDEHEQRVESIHKLLQDIQKKQNITKQKNIEKSRKIDNGTTAICELKPQQAQEERKQVCYDNPKQTLGYIERPLKNTKNDQTITKGKIIDKTTDGSNGEDSVLDTEMTNIEESLPENSHERKKIQNQIDNLRNVAHTYKDIKGKPLTNLNIELNKLSQIVNDLLDQIVIKNNTSIIDSQQLTPNVQNQTEHNIKDENSFSDNAHAKIPYKMKHTKREKSRILIIENELSDLKDRMKEIEEEREDQNYELKMKEKKLCEVQKQVALLQQTLQSHQGTKHQKHMLRTQISLPYLPPYKPPQAIIPRTISYEPLHSSHDEIEKYTPWKQSHQKIKKISLNCPVNCLKDKQMTQKLPHLDQRYMFSKTKHTSTSRPCSSDEKSNKK